MESTKGLSINGGKKVHGEIQCLGAKNFVTKALCVTLLSENQSMIRNFPDIGDTQIVVDMIKDLGVSVEWDNKGNVITVDPSVLNKPVVSFPDSGTNRIPILLLSVLLHKFDEVSVPVLGGCNIGSRKVDFHLKAIEAFGGKVQENENGFTAKKGCQLKGTEFTLPYPSVGATETCLFLAVLSRGTTTLKNIAIEPEITSLIAMLQAMGALIFIRPGREIVIEGVPSLHGVNIKALGDRIESASWACLACATDGSISIRGINLDTLGSFLSFFQKAGGGIQVLDDDCIRFYREKPLKALAIETDVYPGFSTDWQQPFAMMLTQAEGVSIIHETVYEKRFTYVHSLKAMGAVAELSTHCLGATPCRFKNKDYEHSLIITGKTDLSATEELVIPDLRAGLAYLIAASIADGTTILKNVQLLERGYGELISRLSGTNLGISEVSI